MERLRFEPGNMNDMEHNKTGTTIIILTLVSFLMISCADAGAAYSDAEKVSMQALSTETPSSEPTVTAEPSPSNEIPAFKATPETAEPYTLDFVDVFGQHYQTLIDTDLPMNPYTDEGFFREDDIKKYEDDSFTCKVGVDVSRYQGRVDFQKIKDSGFEFVFIRLGYRGYGKTGSIQKDSMFDVNFINAVDAGLDVGVYFFSQAVNEEEAREEADFVLSTLDRIKNDNSMKELKLLGIVYDPESILDHEARTDDVTKEQFTINTIAFLDKVSNEGYVPYLYCNMLWEAYMLEMDKIFDKGYGIWYADYEEFPQTPYDFEIWQYTNEGSVPGIQGNSDINIRFIPK